MRGGHEIPPQPRRRAAAGDVFHRPRVVVTHPYAGHKIGREADEPSVAEVLAGSGLARLGAVDVGGASGAIRNHPGQHAVHGRNMGRRNHPSGAGAAAPVKELSGAVPDFLDAVGPDAGAAVGERPVGLGQVQQADLIDAERQAGRRLEIAGQPETPGGVDDVPAPGPLADPDGDGVDGFGESVGKAYRSGMGFGEISGTPAADRQRRVHEHAVGTKAGFEPGQIDEGLERRPRLAPGLGGPVELAFGVIAAADHGPDRARGRHRHQRRLGDPGFGPGFGKRLGDAVLGQALQAGIEGGQHHQVPVPGIGVIGDLLQYPVGEMAAFIRTRGRATNRTAAFRRLGGLRAEHPGGDHVGEHLHRPGLGAGRVAPGVVAAGSLQ